MASDFDRDNSIDQLLKGARHQAAAGEAGPDCLDAETLAAWADGGLDDDRVRSIEAHVANCARCQAMSAVFVTAGEAAAAAGGNVVPFKRNRLMQWLPIAVGTAAAATLVIWLGVRESAVPEPAATMASGESVRRELPAPAPAPAEPATAPPAAPPASASKQSAAQLAEPKADAGRDRAAAVELRSERSDRAGQRQAGEATKPQPTPVAPPVGAVTTLPPPPPAQVMAAPPPPPPAIAPPPTVQPPVVARQSYAVTAASPLIDTRAKEEVVVIAEFSTADVRSSTISGLPDRGLAVGAGRGGGGGGRGGAGNVAARVADVTRAAPTTYWRIRSSDVVERSTDRATWTAVPIAPPAPGLAVGSAPATNVCWLVGKAGLVLLMTDGNTFTRVTAPSNADLSAVSAVNALQASVRTVDGVTFTTTDGGKSWKQLTTFN